MHWSESGTLARFGCAILLCALALKSLSAIAEEYQCPAVPSLESRAISVETKAGADAVSKLLAKIGIDVNVHTTRNNVLKDNPRADQVVIVLTMANIYCKMIWSDSALKGEEKASRFKSMMQDLLMPAAGPMPIARTTRTGWNENRIVLASNELFKLADLNELTLPKPQVGFLRDAPFLINAYNKYFVIVGSASTREDGLRLMKRLKSKAPEYDFALYEPYGDNPNFGVMMASWVPRDVALTALDIARRTVAHDAFLWACRSTGSSC
ncbi:MAG TPA: hypothetical protein VMT08_27055 [Bradyrhizobium sp.]|nr:hypothetical protein [Bradyrhizobium sp.]